MEKIRVKRSGSEKIRKRSGKDQGQVFILDRINTKVKNEDLTPELLLAGGGVRSAKQV